MIVDAGEIPKNQNIYTDVCIIGSGAAGITLAREFIEKGFNVCLLESGGMKPRKMTRSLTQGENNGIPYRPLEYVRCRFFGGTTNAWHGGCEELDELDFEVRSWVPNSGWPFEYAHLQPFYFRAKALCQLPPFFHDEEWESSFKSKFPLNSNKLIQRIRFRSTNPRFGNLYGQEIINSSNITVYLNATVVQISTNKEANRVTNIRVCSFVGHEFLFTAKLFVLAAGGIENPRLLLASNRINKEGLGNEYDLVGRFFMTHPLVDSGVLFPKKRSFSRAWHTFYKANVGYPKPTIGLSRETQYKEQLLNLNTTLDASYKEAQFDGVTSLIYLLKEGYMVHWSYVPNHFMENVKRINKDLLNVVRYGIKKMVKPYSMIKNIETFHLSNILETAPNPDSRVTLSTKRDALGGNLANLDWRMEAIDKRSLRRSHEIFAKEFEAAGEGRLLVKIDKDEHTWPPTLIGLAHHMGTTRMHVDPKKGVVDANCKVHGLSNLYIAGSSVFPTSGAVAPTFTIVALALKLADHIKGLMIR